jgi:8-oxo-dGTP pyrophosphatase MutT (NUDIX family)
MDGRFHSGPGSLASGILPVARSTGRLCLAWRSSHVHLGNCWGTIGGAAHGGVSLAESARRELREEIGYDGPIELHPAYVFALTDFSYHNFIGIVPTEFTLAANESHAWETVRLRWVELPQLMAELERTPRQFHLGLRRLIDREHPLIARLTRPAEPAAAG